MNKLTYPCFQVVQHTSFQGLHSWHCMGDEQVTTVIVPWQRKDDIGCCLAFVRQEFIDFCVLTTIKKSTKASHRFALKKTQ